MREVSVSSDAAPAGKVEGKTERADAAAVTDYQPNPSDVTITTDGATEDAVITGSVDCESGVDCLGVTHSDNLFPVYISIGAIVLLVLTIAIFNFTSRRRRAREYLLEDEL